MRMSSGLLLGLVLLGAACSTSPREQSATGNDRRVAFVRVVNAIPGAAAVDIFADDQKVFTEVKAGMVAPYREVPRGLTTFRARWAGRDSDSPIADNREILRDGKFTTILLRPASDPKQVDMTVLKDHTWMPETGKSKVRVVHAIPGLSDIDVYSQGKKVLGGVDFKDESRYVEVDAITGDVVLKRRDNQQVVATVSNVPLEANKACTVMLVGTVDKPETIVLADRAERPPVFPTQYPLGT